MLDVSGGTVLVDGVDVRLWDLQALRRRIGMATQRVQLYSDTVEAATSRTARPTTSPRLTSPCTPPRSR